MYTHYFLARSNILLRLFQRYPYHFTVGNMRVFASVLGLVKIRKTLSLRWVVTFGCCFVSVPTPPILISILALRKYVDPRFWTWMPCLKQFRLPAGSPESICLYPPHYEPRMDSRIINILVLGTCYILCEKTTRAVIIVKARHIIFPKFKHIYKTETHFNSPADLIHYPRSRIHRSLSVLTGALVHGVRTHRTQW